MNGNYYLWAALAVSGVALAGALALFIWRCIYWTYHGKKLAEVGYVPPATPYIGRLARYLGARFVLFFKVGRLRVAGAQHVKQPGRLLILSNHTIEHDTVTLPSVLGTLHFRALMASTQITPSRAPLAAFAGVIPVHHDTNPGAAVRSAIAILNKETHSSMLIFPQGKLVRDNKLDRNDFFAGAMLIVHRAAKSSEEPFYVLPVGTDYDRDPKHVPFYQRWLNACGIPFRKWFGETTSAVAVAIGAPIRLDQLPKSNDAAMTVVFEQIQKLCAQAAVMNGKTSRASA